MRVRRKFRALLLFLFPTLLVRPLVNALGYRLAKGAKVGFSWVECDDLLMESQSRIWHFSTISGPFKTIVRSHAYIGHFINVTRARIGVTYGESRLDIGEFSNITSRHRLDLCQSIIIGEHSTIAGNGSQFWTHGYIHEIEDAKRYRIDGSIHIGNNVYIGSMCFISLGVRIGDNVIVGGGSSIAKDLLEPGLYVSSALRMLPRPADPDDRTDLEPVEKSLSCDRVYRKRDAV